MRVAAPLLTVFLAGGGLTQGQMRKLGPWYITRPSRLPLVDPHVSRSFRPSIYPEESTGLGAAMAGVSLVFFLGGRRLGECGLLVGDRTVVVIVVRFINRGRHGCLLNVKPRPVETKRTDNRQGQEPMCTTALHKKSAFKIMRV